MAVIQYLWDHVWYFNLSLFFILSFLTYLFYKRRKHTPKIELYGMALKKPSKVHPKKEVKKEAVPEIEKRPHDITKKRWYTYGKVKELFYKRWSVSKSILIRMQLENGFFTSFLINNDDGKFYYNKKTYIIDSDLKYYDVNAQMWCFDYHESFCMPIERHIPVNDLKKTLKASNMSQLEYATNPSLLERFITSEVIKQVMKGVDIDAFFRQIRLIVIIILLINLLHFILFVYSSGMLSNLRLPF